MAHPCSSLVWLSIRSTRLCSELLKPFTTVYQCDIEPSALRSQIEWTWPLTRVKAIFGGGRENGPNRSVDISGPGFYCIRSNLSSMSF